MSEADAGRGRTGDTVMTARNDRAVITVRENGQHHWQFELVALSGGIGEVHATSPSFHMKAFRPKNKPPARETLEWFVNHLRQSGWEIDQAPPSLTGQDWFAFHLARGDFVVRQGGAYPIQSMPAFPLAPAVPLAPAQRGPSKGIWWMWGLTIAIVLCLFLLCVVLVLSAELRLTPSAS